MLSLIVVVFVACVGALILGLRLKAGPVGNFVLVAISAMAGVFIQSPFLIGKALDRYSPPLQGKLLQRRLENVYIAHQPGGRLNLVTDYKKATEEIRRAVSAGIKRIGDDDQLRRAEHILTLSKLGGDSLCGSFFTNDVDATELAEAVKQLPSAEFESWAAISQNALQMELQQVPYPKVSEFSFYESFDKIQSVLPEIDRQFLKQKYADFSTNKSVSPKEACRCTELLYSAISKTEPQAGPRFMRYVAELPLGSRAPASQATTKSAAPKAEETYQLKPAEFEGISTAIKRN